MSPLEQLLQRPDIWRPGEHRRPPRSGIKTGFAEFDELLHGGGWPRSALVELLLQRCGIGELRLLMPALSAMSQQGLWQVWIDPPYLPFAPAWTQHHLRFDRIVIVRTVDRRHWLWATEQALRAAGCAAVVSWSGSQRPRYAELRKLQVAAGERQCTGFLLTDQRASLSSPAMLRLQLTASLTGVDIEVLKQRGAQAGQRWLMPTSETLTSRLPLRDRPFITRSTPDTRVPSYALASPPLQEVVWQ